MGDRMKREEGKGLDNVDPVDHWKECETGEHWKVLSREMA